MNKYRVKIKEWKESEEINIFEVMADSEDEAIDLAISGEGNLIDSRLMYEDVADRDIEECNLIQKLV